MGAFLYLYPVADLYPVGASQTGAFRAGGAVAGRVCRPDGDLGQRVFAEVEADAFCSDHGTGAYRERLCGGSLRNRVVACGQLFRTGSVRFDARQAAVVRVDDVRVGASCGIQQDLSGGTLSDGYSDRDVRRPVLGFRVVQSVALGGRTGHGFQTVGPLCAVSAVFYASLARKTDAVAFGIFFAGEKA